MDADVAASGAAGVRSKHATAGAETVDATSGDDCCCNAVVAASASDTML